MAAEVLHLVMLALGMALGWYIKHQSIGIPPEILTALKEVLAQRQKKDGHSTLRDILQDVEKGLESGASTPGVKTNA